MSFKNYTSPPAGFLHVFAFIFSFLLIGTSCEEPSSLGLEVLPDDDSFSIHTSVYTDIETSLWKRDSIVGLNNPVSLLGAMDDPVFGEFSASFMTQVLIASFHNFGDDPTAESLVLNLHVVGLYGQEGVSQEISVYHLQDHMDKDKHVFSNFDPMTMDPQPVLVTRQVVSVPEGDSIIAVPITNRAIQNTLLNAPDSARQTINDFVKFFKGLYVTAEIPAGDRGFINTVNLNSSLSKLTLYYRNEAFPDSILHYDYPVNESAARINLFKHDYGKAVFSDALGKTETGDSLFYIQGGHGVMSRLDFEHLHVWRDSMQIEPFSLNSAKLHLPVSRGQDTDDYPLPDKLLLLEKNEEGNMVMIDDLRLGDSYFGGNFNSEKGEYVINITNWVNSYITSKHDRNSIYLDVRGAGNYPHLVTLKNMYHPEGGVRLEMLYTRL